MNLVLVLIYTECEYTQVENTFFTMICMYLCCGWKMHCTIVLLW